MDKFALLGYILHGHINYIAVLGRKYKSTLPLCKIIIVPCAFVKLDIELQLSGKLLRDADSDMIIYIGNQLVSES